MAQVDYDPVAVRFMDQTDALRERHTSNHQKRVNEALNQSFLLVATRCTALVTLALLHTELTILLRSGFCLLTSLMCLVYMLFIAFLISIDYDYLGEWKSTGLIPATEDEKTSHANNCYIVAGIYGVLSVISAIALWYHRRK